MSAIPHHTSDAVCPLCEEKLLQADTRLVNWFHAAKVKHPDLHVSWSYRDQSSQEQAVLDKVSRLTFPDSAHNKSPSLALDVFQINDQGVACWNRAFLSALNDESVAGGYALKWGGQWKDLGDYDHFEIA